MRKSQWFFPKRREHENIVILTDLGHEIVGYTAGEANRCQQGTRKKLEPLLVFYGTSPGYSDLELPGSAPLFHQCHGSKQHVHALILVELSRVEYSQRSTLCRLFPLTVRESLERNPLVGHVRGQRADSGGTEAPAKRIAHVDCRPQRHTMSGVCPKP
jgi:hypothetical protein